MLYLNTDNTSANTEELNYSYSTTEEIDQLRKSNIATNCKTYLEYII